MHFIYRRLLLALCCFIGQSPGAQGRAAEYTVEGTLSHYQFPPAGGTPVKSEEHFKMAVSSGRWIITERLKQPEGAIEKITAFDGTNTFQLKNFYAPPGETGPRLQSAPLGSINPFDMPPPDPMFATPLVWLAYASDSQFRNATARQLRPVWVLHEPPLWHTGFKVTAAWQVAGNPPYLPEHVEYVDDGWMHSLNRSSTSFLYPAFTNVIYTAAFTNFFGKELPAAFSMSRFNMDYSPGAHTNLILTATDEGAAETISPMCDQRVFRPALPALAVISDCRLQQSHRGYVFRYEVTNGDWNVSPYNSLVARVEKQQAAMIRRATLKPRVILCAMVLFSGAFLLLHLKFAGRADSPVADIV